MGQQQQTSGVGSAGIEAEVEGRLASLGPGVEVLMVETAPTRGSRALRVLLDRPGGVDHDLCARASHELQGLSRELAIEVSSPGPDRPLT
ncbi:hypothetical protein LCGC14_2548430, partial [marine sediment metagenome]